MGMRQLLVIAIGLGYFHPTTALGRPPTRDEVQAWFDREWEAAEQPLRLENVTIEYRTELKRVMAPDALARLRESVRGKPEHPRRGELAAAERHARGEWTTYRARLWIRSPDEWRYSLDMPVPNEYTDIAVTRDRAWSMTPHNLTIVDPRRGYPEHADLRNHGLTFLNDLDGFLSGGLRNLRRFGFTAGPVQISGAGWEVMIVPAEGSAGMLMAGNWELAAGRGLIARVDWLEDSTSRASVASRTVLRGWRKVEELDRWAATVVDHLAKDGTLEHTHTLTRVTAVPPGTFEAVTATPALGVQDPVRGAPTFGSVRDFAQGQRLTLATATGAGSTPDAPARTESTAPLARPGDDGPTAWQRWGGWATAAGIAGILVVLLARRLRA